MVMRALRHLFIPDWVAMRSFPASALKAIEAAVRSSERQHDGEIRFVIEAGLPFSFLTSTTRRRAEALFAQLGVWDTAHNSGVLIYVQLVDRRIEIVADRGIAAKIEQSEWDAICREMQSAYSRRDFMSGSLEGIDKITDVLARHFPPRGRNPNELTDKPVVL
jgi:uncharacterized membrane protein